MIKSIQNKCSSFRLFLGRGVLLFAAFVIIGLIFIGCVMSPRDNSAALPENSPPLSENKLSHLSSSSIPPLSGSIAQYPSASRAVVGNSVSPGSIFELIELLKEHGIWNLGPVADVSPLLVDGFPVDLAELDVSSKKRVFFHTLLPVVMAAQDEVQAERQQLKDVLVELGEDPSSITFSDDNSAWKAKLSDDELIFIQNISQKYRHENGAELLKRVNVLPVSLVLAQGALESSWGTSRFANMGNNLFGMWTWGEQGIVPLGRSAGKTHKLAVYDSILDSVRAYLLTINRIPAYEELRNLRDESMDPITLTKGLIYYSERRQDYVDDLQSVISYNELAVYDHYRLSPPSNASI